MPPPGDLASLMSWLMAPSNRAGGDLILGWPRWTGWTGWTGWPACKCAGNPFTLALCKYFSHRQSVAHAQFVQSSHVAGSGVGFSGRGFQRGFRRFNGFREHGEHGGPWVSRRRLCHFDDKSGCTFLFISIALIHGVSKIKVRDPFAVRCNFYWVG